MPSFFIPSVIGRIKFSKLTAELTVRKILSRLGDNPISWTFSIVKRLTIQLNVPLVEVAVRARTGKSLLIALRSSPNRAKAVLKWSPLYNYNFMTYKLI